jgi:hypothetical protein
VVRRDPRMVFRALVPQIGGRACGSVLARGLRGCRMRAARGTPEASPRDFGGFRTAAAQRMRPVIYVTRERPIPHGASAVFTKQTGIDFLG